MGDEAATIAGPAREILTTLPRRTELCSPLEGDGAPPRRRGIDPWV